MATEAIRTRGIGRFDMICTSGSTPAADDVPATGHEVRA